MRIVFNGVEYAGLDHMPAEVRSQYLNLVAQLGDANRNGIPDAVEQTAGAAPRVVVSQRLVVNGREYSDPAQLPPELRVLLDNAGRGTVIRDPALRISTPAAADDARLTVAFTHPDGRWLALASFVVILALIVALKLWRMGIL